MCEFLTGHNDNDRRKIASLEMRANAERHACDALFAVLSKIRSNPNGGDVQKAMELYSHLLLARTTDNYYDIEGLSHQIMDEHK